MNNLQDQGRACYKRGDYKKAVELFDRAIGRSPSVLLLDNRAACYEKLNDYTTALKDAKKAIQLHREDAVGYLRAGRVLVKMEKQSVALEIYTHGLKCIKHVGQGYEQLRKVHKELMDQLCPPKSVDPLTVLPRELAETVLEYLSFRQRMNTCLVSKQWMQFIRSTPNLWRHLDLSGARRKVRTAFVSRVINTARARLKNVTLSNLYDFDKTLNAIAKHCPIEELTLLECGLQSHNLTTLLAPAKTLRSLKLTEGSRLNSYELRPLLASLSDRLEVLDCSIFGRQSPGEYHVPCHRLKSLSLSFGDDCGHSGFFDQVSDHFPALQTLILRQNHNQRLVPGVIDFSGCKQLRHLGFHMGSRVVQQLRFPPGLAILELDCWSPLSEPASDLPVLEELAVRGLSSLRAIQYLLDEPTHPSNSAAIGKDLEASHRSQLRKLSALESSCADCVDMASLFSHPRIKGIETLSLARTVGVGDDVVGGLASSKLEQLRNVDLTGTDLSGVGVKWLVSNLSLSSLVLNECRNVSPDAVEWARSKGVAVQHRMSNNLAGGRKIRY